MSTRAFPFILVAGGCRSGKSAYAQKILESLAPVRIYAATAEIRDPDMARRVAAHQAGRGEGWRTVETPLGRLPLLPSPLPKHCGVLFDCLSVWTAGRMESGPDDEDAVMADVRACLKFLYDLPCPVVIVATETGLGVIPADRTSRRFRDFSGLAAQEAARTAHDVYFMLCGLPLCLKGTPPTIPAFSPFHDGESLHASGQTG